MKNLRTILAVLPLFSSLAGLDALASPLGAAISYQGKLVAGGVPANASYDFQFTLYDAVSSGMLVAGPVTKLGVPVSGGLFTVEIDFGASPYAGNALWLLIAVRPAGNGAYTSLAPRQPLDPAPYALYSKAGVATDVVCAGCVHATDVASGQIVKSLNSLKDDVTLVAGGPNVTITPAGSTITIAATTGALALPYAASASTASAGFSISNSGLGYGIEGTGTGGNAGVHGASQFDPGVYGSSDGAPGVQGHSTGSDGVWGRSDSIARYGVYGSVAAGTQNAGVGGESTASNGAGVKGRADTGGDSYGVWGISSQGYAGYFEGKVHVTGNLEKPAGSFKIDHPLDPANKYLSHSFVESPDMMNIYDGLVTTDSRGEATVELPAYFEALNRAFRYQLTVIGDFAQAIVARKIADNRFLVKTSRPHVEVSWQVTGIRQDAYANANRIVVEEDKSEKERGSYLYPRLFGQPEEKAVERMRGNRTPGYEGDGPPAKRKLIR